MKQSVILNSHCMILHSSRGYNASLTVFVVQQTNKKKMIAFIWEHIPNPSVGNGVPILLLPCDHLAMHTGQSFTLVSPGQLPERCAWDRLLDLCLLSAHQCSLMTGESAEQSPGSLHFKCSHLTPIRGTLG